MTMLQRIWGSKKEKGKEKQLPFLSYSLFGDPLPKFSSLPDRQYAVWSCLGGDHTVLRLLLGMAWLNNRTVSIRSSDPVRLSGWAVDAGRDALTLLETPSGSMTPGTSLSDMLTAWRKEWHTFHEATQKLREVRFGVINALEAAHTLLRLQPGVPRLPFGWADRQNMRWEPGELQEVLNLLRQNEWLARGRVEQVMAQRMDIKLSVLHNWSNQALDRTLDDRLDRLLGQIREFEFILFRIRALLQSQTAPGQSADEQIRRATVLGLDVELRDQSGLSAWLPATDLLEKELISDSWFNHFRGFQGISLEETDRELRSMYTRLQILRQRSAEWLEGARSQAWLQAQVEPWRGLLTRASDLWPAEHEPAFTFWYLYGWLEKTVPVELWHHLSETSHRKALALHLPQLTLQTMQHRLADNKTGLDPSSWWTVDHVTAPVSEGQITLFWDDLPFEPATDHFQFQVREDPAIPIEYLRLQQDWHPEDPAMRYALPHPMPTLPGFWEGTPGRWGSGAEAPSAPSEYLIGS